MQKPTTEYPPLPKTLAALQQYDKRAVELHKELLGASTSGEVMAICEELDRLAEKVGAAYGEETSDRNNPETCRKHVRPGPPPALFPEAELSLVRKMVAQWQEQASKNP
jgi:hypothetical protein